MTDKTQAVPGPVALVTGALTGIGRATAFILAGQGARVVVSGRHAEAGESLARELQATGAEAEFVLADVRSEAQVEAMIARAVDRFGQLDAAVNNAGTEGDMVSFADLTTENLAAVFDTNVVGLALCMKHELRVMLPRGKGSIVNVTSIFGHAGLSGRAAYSASKHAVEGLTKSAALEFAASGVRINSVAPGGTVTTMLERTIGKDNLAAVAPTLATQRFGRPEEVAEAIAFLASDRAPYITGHSLAVDGGFLAA